MDAVLIDDNKIAPISGLTASLRAKQESQQGGSGVGRLSVSTSPQVLAGTSPPAVQLSPIPASGHAHTQQSSASSIVAGTVVAEPEVSIAERLQRLAILEEESRQLHEKLRQTAIIREDAINKFNDCSGPGPAGPAGNGAMMHSASMNVLPIGVVSSPTAAAGQSAMGTGQISMPPMPTPPMAIMIGTGSPTSSSIAAGGAAPAGLGRSMSMSRSGSFMTGTGSPANVANQMPPLGGAANRSLSSEEEAALFTQMRDPYNGITVMDRRWRLRMYPTCFVGSELCDWFIATG
jgi:hypothetical protein